MSSKKKTTSTSQATPPSWALPTITDLSGKINQAVNDTAGMKYEGDFVAGPTDWQTQGLAMQQQAIAQQQSNAAAVQGLAEGLKSFNPNIAPINVERYTPGAGVQTTGDRRTASLSQGFGDGNLQSAIEAYARDPMRQATEQALPQLTASAIANGAYGSEAAAVTLPSLIARDMNEAIANIAARMSYQDFADTRAYNQSEQQFTDQFNEDVRRQDLGFDYGTYQDFINNQMNAVQLQEALKAQAINAELARVGGAVNAMGAANQFSMMPGQNLFDLGSIQQGFAQDQLDNEIAKFQEAYAAPWRGLEMGTNLITPLSTPYVRTDSKQTQTTGGLGEVVKGAMGLGAMGLAAFGGGGPLAGALGGAGSAAGGMASNVAQAASQAFMPTFAPQFSPMNFSSQFNPFGGR